jgi:hypothetical protein
VLTRCVADLGRRQAVHFEHSVVALRDRHAGRFEDLAEAGSPGRTNVNKLSGCLPQELVNADVRDQPSASDHDYLFSSQRHLTHQMGRHENRPSLGGEALQQVANPMDPFRVEAVDRLIEDQRRRVPEQCARDTQPLAHAERKLSCAFLRHVVQAHKVDQLVDATPCDSVCLREGEQMVEGRASRMHRTRLEQRTHLMERRRVVAIMLAVHRHVPAAGCIQAENEPDRRRLARPVRPEKAGDDPRTDGEGEIVDRPLVAVVLREVARLDQRVLHGSAGSAGRDSPCLI